MIDSSSKSGESIQAISGSTLNICYAVHALDIIGTWLIGKSLLEVINKVHPLVNLS